MSDLRFPNHTDKPVAVEIWCAQCGAKGEVLGRVWHAEGLPFEGLSALSDRGYAERKKVLDETSSIGRRPFLSLGVTKVNLDGGDVEDQEDWPPRAGCHPHGESQIPAATLLAAARSHKPGTRPRKVTIHA